jgi:hypothetical protein
LGNWISVYADAPEKLAEVVGSKDHSKAAAFRVEHPQYLARLIDADYEPGGEADDAGYLIQAFETVCDTVCPARCTVEVYLDEQSAPEMWRFVWTSETVPFDLPLSSFGTPAVSTWANSELPKLAAELKVPEIRTVLEEAQRANVGVLVFYSE